MEPWAEDLISDDLQSMSFNSTTTTTDVINRSTSSGSETTFTASSSVHCGGGNSFSSSASAVVKPRASPGDPLSDALRRVRSDSPAGTVALPDLRLLRRLGAGDIGAVYLAELKPAEGCLFAAKVMDRKELAGRKKEGRAVTEREILELLDHPFLPTLYASLESPKWSCLLTEFCPGGDLHVLRQRQSAKRFDELAVRCVRH